MIRLKQESGDWVYYIKTIETMANNYFLDLFTSSHPMDANIEEALVGIDGRISDEMSVFLEAPYTSLEVKEALF